MNPAAIKRAGGRSDLLPPRERILAAARDLFYRQGFRAVGVDAIAEAAATNKMTLYRHFDSKDELIAECLRQIGAEIELAWEENARRHAGDPKGQLLTWLRYVVEFKLNPAERGCAFVNAAVELPAKDHPARKVVEAHKTLHRQKIIDLCCEAGLVNPETLADQLFLLVEGARVSQQSVGAQGPAARCVELVHALVEAHDTRAAG